MIQSAGTIMLTNLRVACDRTKMDLLQLNWDSLKVGLWHILEEPWHYLHFQFKFTGIFVM